MKILILTTYFPPLNSIASLRPYSWAKYWSLEGHEVSVITLRRNQGDHSLILPTKGFNLQEIKEWSPLQRLKPHRNERTVSSGNSKGNWVSRLREGTGIFSAIRMPDLTDLWIKPALSYIHGMKTQFDLVVSTSGPYAPHVVAYRLKKQDFAKRWVADFRDLWVDHHFYKGVWPFVSYEKHLEKKYVSFADLVTVVSPRMKDIYTKKYPQAHIEIVENGIDPEDWHTLDPTPIFPNDQKIRIVYTGTIQTGKRDPSPLFKALLELSEDPQWKNKVDRIEVNFTGHSLGNLDSLIEKYKVCRWVKNLGRNSHSQALRMQRDADILLFLEWNDPSAHYMLTGKLFEYLYANNFLLGIGVSENSDAGKLILKNNAGRLCVDSQAVKAYLKEVLQGCVAPKTSAHQLAPFVRENLAKKFLQFL